MRVLRSPGFRLLLAGQAVNAIGNWVALIAIWGFAAFRFDAGAGDLALLFVILSLPGVLLGPLLGVPIDRLGPRRTLILANALGLVDALALTQADTYGWIIGLALPLGLIEALASASLDALPPRLFDDAELLSANAVLAGAQDLAVVVGPLLAAVVNARWGLPGAFFADAVTFGVGLAVVLPLTLGPAGGPSGASAWRELREGVGLVRASSGLRWTLGVAATTYALWAMFGVLAPLYVREVLGRSDTVFAMLQAVFGLGLVGAGLALVGLGDRVARPVWVATATIVSGATAALYLGTRSVVVAFIGVFLWGVDVAFFYAPAKTLLQRYAPMPAHGRVLSLNQSLEPLAGLVMAPAVALGAGVLGLRQLGVVGGAVAAVAGLVALRLARRLPPPPPAGPVDPKAGNARDAVAQGSPAPGSPRLRSWA
ncbi:MAG: MFS transporter [Acidimicrobiales bacterium]